MQRLIALHCPNCGAEIEPSPPGSHVTCRFCGHAFDVASEPAPPAVGQSVATGGAGGIIVVALLGVALVAGGVAYAVSRGKGASIPSLGAALASAAYFWDTVAGPPIPVVLKGQEGFVGRVRTHDASDTLYVVAFDHDLKEAWKVGPFGTYTQGYQSTSVAAVGQRVVVTDYRASVHVYDLPTGKEVHTLTLSDRPKGMCVAPDAAKVWIEVSDGNDMFVDPQAGTATAGKRPAWCPQYALGNDCRGWLGRGAPRLDCHPPTTALKVNAFEADNVVEVGDLAVALGRKHPGTAVPMAVGFDPATKAMRWSQPLSIDQMNVAEATTTSIMDEISGGRFVAPYQLQPKGWHFTAFDARSGERLWDVPLQPGIGDDQPEGFSLSPERLYVTRFTNLEVYDAKTGAFVGKLGL